MYKNVKILNPKEHSFYRYTTPDNLYFAKDLNLIPITFSEIKLLCCDFPIVIIKNKEEYMLTLLVGEKTNQALDENGKWQGEYLPAFIRKYPFILSNIENQEQLHLGFDMESGCFSSPEGQALFEADGTPTHIITESMSLLENIAKEMQITGGILAKLAEYEVLEQSSYTITKEGEESRAVGGFFVINREKISKLQDEQLLQISKNGWMEMIELHTLSLKNISKLA